MDQARDIIDKAVKSGKWNYSDLSKAIGKNHAYLQQFVKRGIPRNLPEDTRHKLAHELGIDESQLRGADQVALTQTVAPAKFLKSSRHKFYIQEWREFMGSKVESAASAVGLDVDGYLAHETHPINFNLGQVTALAEEFGIRGDQFWFSPPKARQAVPSQVTPRKIRLRGK
jgi:hypothetical protein